MTDYKRSGPKGAGQSLRGEFQYSSDNVADFVERVCARFIVYGGVGIAAELATPVAYSPSGLVQGVMLAMTADATIQGVRASADFLRGQAVQRRIRAAALAMALATNELRTIPYVPRRPRSRPAEFVIS